MGGEEFGQIIDVGKSAVSKLEQATQHLDAKQARTLDQALDTGGLLDVLVALELQDRRHQRKSLNYADLETTATTIKTFEALIVTALLQTPEYARAIIETSGESPDAVESYLETRLARQAVLTRPSPPLVLVLLSEAVLDWPVGSPKVMADQLGHLLDMGQATNVEIGVIPRSAGAFVGLDGSFKILSEPTGHVGYTEAPGGAKFTFALDAQPFIDRFARIGFIAHSARESLALIEQKRKDYLE